MCCYELNATEKVMQQQILQFLIKEKQLFTIIQKEMKVKSLTIIHDSNLTNVLKFNSQ
jgi:hypothetical protein